MSIRGFMKKMMDKKRRKTVKGVKEIVRPSKDTKIRRVFCGTVLVDNGGGQCTDLPCEGAT